MIERLFDDIKLTVVFGGMIIFVLYGFWFIGYKIYDSSTQNSRMCSCLWMMKKRLLQRGKDKPYQNTNQEALPTRLLLANSRLFIVKKEA